MKVLELILDYYNLDSSKFKVNEDDNKCTIEYVNHYKPFVIDKNIDEKEIEFAVKNWILKELKPHGLINGKYIDILTLKKAKDLIGKTISWHSEQSDENKDGEGVAIILEVVSDRNPLKVQTLSGDATLSYVFYEKDSSSDLHLGDLSRIVTYEVVE